MTDEHWRRVPALFAACLEREPGERRTFLADVGADLVREVEALLAAHGASGPFDRLVSQMDGLRGEALAALLGEANDPEPARKERPPAFQPGHRLGRHQIGARLGAGGKGEVYRAFDARLRREVAIKTLRQPLRQRPAAHRGLEQEARAASAINHPNIVTVHDIGEDEACPYIVMELVPGSSLRDLFGQPWPVDRLLHVAVQIADGLTAAHEHGIVHGDLKPENILVSPQGVVKILDFGSARFRLDDESGGAGTPGYVSPERLRGRPMDMRADQFSFGTILYEMATGRRAFPGQTMLETLTRMLEDDPPPVSETRSDLPEPLESGIARCLSKEPAERYESTRELLDELHHARRSSFTARRTAAGSRLRRSPIPSSGARDSSAT